ncbi:MAG: AMP-dependent synthetase, partial [Clostridia bacterium]|nr:AMP-dependent synthetase [Clostridia bacterium]
FDDEGYYYITGRLKNVIVTPNGKNIYPEEIEAKLTDYPEIKEALVYEGSTDKEESAVCAKIATEESYDRIKEIIKEVNDNNAPYKAIKAFTLCDELPKNSSHKIIRNK